MFLNKPSSYFRMKDQQTFLKTISLRFRIFALLKDNSHEGLTLGGKRKSLTRGINFISNK